MGLKLFPRDEGYSSPTVTAIYVPNGWSWKTLDGKLRERGVVFGGSYGILKDRVFRVGHMGSQADLDLVSRALDILEDILTSR